MHTRAQQLAADISRYGGAHIFVISQFNENGRCALCLKLPSDHTYNRPRRSRTFSNFEVLIEVGLIQFGDGNPIIRSHVITPAIDTLTKRIIVNIMA